MAASNCSIDAQFSDKISILLSPPPPPQVQVRNPSTTASALYLGNLLFSENELAFSRRNTSKILLLKGDVMGLK